MRRATRARLTLCAGAALLLAGCRWPKARPPMPSFPAEASINCFVPGPDDYQVTIVVADTIFRDSSWLRPMLSDIARNWPVTLPLPKLSVDVAVDLFRDGRATDPRIVKSSHVRDFDARARGAVRAAVDDTLWPIPARYPHDTLHALVRFGAPDATGAVVQTWYSIVKPPKPRRDNPQPDYPAAKRAGQQVVAAFTVDTLGGVDPASIAVLASTDDAYAAAILDVLPRWRFTPSMIRGCKVARTVRWEFPGKD